jgi:WD40 repeat protein
LAFAVLADGRLASGSDDATIKLWNVRELAEVGRLETGIDNQLYDWDGTPTGYTRDAVTALVALPDGMLASGYLDGTIRVWDSASARRVTEIRSGAEHVWALAVLLDGRLASGSFEKEIRLWDFRTGSDAGYLSGDAGYFTKLLTLPGGRLVSNAGDGTIRLWDPGLGRQVGALAGGADALAVTAGGQLVTAAGPSIQLWDLSKECLFGSVTVENPVTCLITSGAGRIVAGDRYGRLHWLQIEE